MSQSYAPSIVPTAHVPNLRPGAAILTPNVLQQVQPYYQQRPVYGVPSMMDTTAVVRQPVVSAVGVYVEHPAWNQFDHVVVWLGDTVGLYKPSPASSVAAQKARTFGGSGAPYYQAVKAPSISDVAAYMGGVINGR